MVNNERVEVLDRFFDLSNSAGSTTSNRNNELMDHIALISSDMRNSGPDGVLISALVDQIGYPLWSNSIREMDSLYDITYIPFSRDNENYVSSIVIVSNENELLKYDRWDKAQLKKGAQFNQYTDSLGYAKKLLVMRYFDSYVYEEVDCEIAGLLDEELIDNEEASTDEISVRTDCYEVHMVTYHSYYDPQTGDFFEWYTSEFAYYTCSSSVGWSVPTGGGGAGGDSDSFDPNDPRSEPEEDGGSDSNDDEKSRVDILCFENPQFCDCLRGMD